MHLFKKIIALALLPCVAGSTIAVAESSESDSEESPSEGETLMQEAMGEFEQWRQERSQGQTGSSSGGIDWSNYTRESGWSTGLSGDAGSHRAVPDLSRGSLVRSDSLVMGSAGSSSGSEGGLPERGGPVSSLVGEFSEIGRGGPSAGRSLFDGDGATTSPGSSSFSRTSSAMEERESHLSRRNSDTTTPFHSTPWTSRAATTEAATTDPDDFTPSQPRRSRPQNLTPDYLRH